MKWILLLTTLVFCTEAHAQSRKKVLDSLYAQINHERQIRGIAPMKVSKSLQRSAYRYVALTGAKKHAMGWASFRRLITLNKRLDAAECIAWGGEESVKAWMKSPRHKALVLAKDHKKMGIGYIGKTAVLRMTDR